jgi:hypothetical protein
MVTIHHITSEGDAATTTGLTDETTDAKDVMDENRTINRVMSGVLMEHMRQEFKTL